MGPRQVLHASVGGGGGRDSDFDSSFGHSVSSHLLNLEGLAATATASAGAAAPGWEEDDRSSPLLCDPEITHGLRRLGGPGAAGGAGAWAPLALFVDSAGEREGGEYGERDGDKKAYGSGEGIGDEGEGEDGDVWALPAVGVGAGDLPPELVEYTEASRLHHDRRTNSSGGGARQDGFEALLARGGGAGAGAGLVWRRPADEEAQLYDERYCRTSQPHRRRRGGDDGNNRRRSGTGSGRRHVDWDEELSGRRESDDEGDEEEDDDEEEERSRRRRQLQRQREELRRQNVEAQRHGHGQLEEAWRERLSIREGASAPPGSSRDGAPPSSPAPSWRDFHRSAPYSPASVVSMPPSSLDSSSSPLVEIAVDRARQLLEGCDACQGAVVMMEGGGGGGGGRAPSSSAAVALALLEFYGDECPSAGRLAVPFVPPSRAAGGPAPSRPRSSALPPPQRRLEAAVRSNVRAGLELSSLVDGATAVLPLSGAGGAHANAAGLAAALEAATLPYRLHDSAQSRSRYGAGMGVNTASDYLSGGSLVPRLSFPAFLAALVPTSAHCLLELDALTPWDSAAAAAAATQAHDDDPGVAGRLSSSSLSPWQARILQGTTAERRLLLTSGAGPGAETGSDAKRLRRGELAQAAPGAWLRHPPPRGLVSSWSPRGGVGVGAGRRERGGSRTDQGPLDGDRSVHEHFGLLASLRAGGGRASPSSPRIPPLLPSTEDYVTCLLQGMGIRYRPERAAACAVSNQSLDELVRGSAVGAYWKALAPSKGGSASAGPVGRPSACDAPVLAVLGNSTRSHGYLSSVVEEMRDAVSSSGGTTSSLKRGWFLRDVACGALPEEDECVEALSRCLDVRDVYRPPNRLDLEEGDADGEDF